MKMFGGFLLYLGSLSILLTAAIIAAGAFLSDPHGGSAASATKAAQKAVEAARKEAEPAKTSAKSSADRGTKTGHRQKRTTSKAKKNRPAVAQPADTDPTGTVGYAPPDSRMPFFIHYGR